LGLASSQVGTTRSLSLPLPWWVVVLASAAWAASSQKQPLSLFGFLGLPRVLSPQNKSLIGDSQKKISKEMQKFSEIIG